MDRNDSTEILQPQTTPIMKSNEQKRPLMWNTILWLMAMALPAVFSLAFASTKFPWPMIVPFLFFGPMLASNKMLAGAMEKAAGAEEPK